ncbi:MAG: prolipoprotein diacylglyceryl transferase, partial [Chloroflexi bacterium]|nr:prolipoprotein diacylglyceryl transferase [Chloroflexota bacterium]
VVLAILWRRRERWPYPGAALLAFVSLYGSARLSLESFRGDSWVVFGSLRGVQVVALVAATVALAVVAWRAGMKTADSSRFLH